MDTGKRDPRVDPTNGDLVRVGEFVRRVIRAERGGVWWIHDDHEIGETAGLCSLKNWRLDCATATVVTVAGEEGR